jgi:hypothetical protein
VPADAVNVVPLTLPSAKIDVYVPGIAAAGAEHASGSVVGVTVGVGTGVTVAVGVGLGEGEGECDAGADGDAVGDVEGAADAEGCADGEAEVGGGPPPPFVALGSEGVELVLLHEFKANAMEANAISTPGKSRFGMPYM